MSQEPTPHTKPGAGASDASADELRRLRDENEALRSRFTRRRSSRRWLAGMLVVLTVVATTASTVAIWAQQTLTDTDRFMAVVEPALADPALTVVLRNHVADASLEALDLETRTATMLAEVDAYLSEALVEAIDPDPRLLASLQAVDRPTLAALSPSISAALEARVVGIVDRFVTSEQFQSRVPDLVRRAHTSGVALATDDLEALPNVYLEDGEVRLDLLPVVIEALDEVRAELSEFLPDVTLPAVVAGRVQQGREQLRQELGESLQARLPADFGQLTLMRQRSLEEVQQTTRYANRLVWGITLLALALPAAAIAVSPTRRRTIVQLALGVVAGLVIAMRLARRLEAEVLDALTDPDSTQAIRSLIGELASDLRTLTVLVAVGALVIGILAYLAGRPRWITDLGRRWTRLTAPSVEGRHLDRWVADHSDALRLAGVAVAVALLVVIGVDLLPLLGTAALLALYLWAIGAACSRVDAPQSGPPDPTMAPDPTSEADGHAAPDPTTAPDLSA